VESRWVPARSGVVEPWRPARPRRPARSNIPRRRQCPRRRASRSTENEAASYVLSSALHRRRSTTSRGTLALLLTKHRTFWPGARSRTADHRLAIFCPLPRGCARRLAWPACSGRRRASILGRSARAFRINSRTFILPTMARHPNLNRPAGSRATAVTHTTPARRAPIPGSPQPWRYPQASRTVSPLRSNSRTSARDRPCLHEYGGS
jgi:hypothetical protein